MADLSDVDFDRFSRWFEEFLADRWDRQIEAVNLAGRLDAADRQAEEDHQTGRCSPLPP